MGSGLFQALDSSISSILTSSQAFSVVSNNIANANNDGDTSYIKRVVKTAPQVSNGISAGVIITSLVPTVDQFALLNVRNQKAVLGISDTINTYVSQLDVLLGDVNNKNYIGSKINNFYSSISSLSSTPESSFSRHGTVLAAEDLAKSISTLAREIQELRFSIDTEMGNVVSGINKSLQNLQYYNTQRFTYDRGSEGYASLNESITNELNNLASMININTYTDPNDQLSITTTDGKSLLNENKYVLEYSPATSLDVFVKGLPLNPVLSYIVSQSGNNGFSQEIISGGASNAVKPYITGGKLYGLQQLRDVIFPQMLERLDNLAFQINNNFNQFHNSGGGVVNKQSIKGETPFQPTDARDWSGMVRIAVVDIDGKPVYADSSNKRYLKPLDLDLSSIDYGNGGGAGLTAANFQKEINEYFQIGPISNRVRLGGLNGSDPYAPGGIEDIKLVSKQDTTSAGNSFTFDFELQNGDSSDHTFQILNMSINNGGSVSNFSTESFTSVAGKRQRSGSSGTNTVTLNGNGGEYTITARLMVTNNKTKETSVSDVTYVVSDTETNAMNSRYSATSASGKNTINGTLGGILIPSSSNQIFLTSSIVDANGNTSIATGANNYLTLNSSNYHIVIDDNPVDVNNQNINYPSSENGLTSNPSVKATKKGWSHYYAMNNLFVENDTVAGSAYKMAVRQDLTLGSGYDQISIGGIRNILGTKDTIKTEGTQQSQLSFKLNSLPSVNDTITINGLTFTFNNTGSTPTTIDISSGNLQTIVQNIVNKLNTVNHTLTSSGVNLVSFAVDINDNNKFIIKSKASGSIGNAYTVAAQFASATASIDGASGVSNINTTLKGGLDSPTNASVQSYGFGIAKADTQVLNGMLSLQNKVIKFSATSNSSAINLTIGNYTNQNVLTYFTNTLNNAQINAKNDRLSYDQFIATFRAGTGVNIDMELANMIKFQATYNASAKIIGTVSQLFDSLLAAF